MLERSSEDATIAANHGNSVKGSSTPQINGLGSSQVPFVYSVMPAHSAWQALVYVLPSLPHTGKASVGQMQFSHIVSTKVASAQSGQLTGMVLPFSPL